MLSCTGNAIIRFHNEAKVQWIQSDEIIWTVYQSEFGHAWEGTTDFTDVVWLAIWPNSDGHIKIWCSDGGYTIVQQLKFSHASLGGDVPIKVSHWSHKRFTDDELRKWVFRDCADAYEAQKL